MMKRITTLLIFAVMSAIVPAHANQVVLNTISEPALTESVKSKIEGMSRAELKEVHEHYIQSLSSVVEYLHLTTGEKVDLPYLATTIFKRNYVDNILSMKRLASEIYPKANLATAAAEAKQHAIQVRLSDLTLIKDGNSCTTNPIVEEMHTSEIHTFQVSCELDAYPKEKISTMIAIGYSQDFVLRTADQDFLTVDIFSNDANTTSNIIDTYDDEIELSLSLSYKPIS